MAARRKATKAQKKRACGQAEYQTPEGAGIMPKTVPVVLGDGFVQVIIPGVDKTIVIEYGHRNRGDVTHK